MARVWTEKQNEAITDRGNDLLVSAAAGSGKTAVLVERIIRLILEDRIPVMNMLVVTFTKAAASEMRERIQMSLREKLASETDPVAEEFLRAQVSDLPRANITNFHSFASTLLREYFAVAGIDPAFRVADEVQADLLKRDALDDLFEIRFGETGERKEAFLSYLRSYAPARSEENVRDSVLSISDFLDSLPDPDAWLLSAASFPEMTREEFEQTDLFRFLLQDIDRELSDAVESSDRLVALLQSNPCYKDHLLDIAVTENTAIKTAKDAFRVSFDEGRNALNGITFARFAALKAEKEAYDADGPYAKRLRAVYHNADKSHPGVIEKLTRLFGPRSLDDALEMIRATAPPAALLTELVSEFRALYREKKDAEKLLDFADLESYALAVLRDDATHETLKNRFRYIFVDEYQDSNRVQETLVKSLKSPSNSLFFVGDVKQSIYRFRLAEPAIFNARAARYQGASLDAHEKKIDLNRNFRSEGSVLSSVNALFSTLMEPTVSGIVYDETQALIPGTEEAEKAKTPVELHLVDPRGEEPVAADESAEEAESADVLPEEELKDAEKEARLAASLLLRDLGKPYYNFNTKQEEILCPQDAVILLRASTSASVFEDALSEAGIPVITDTGDSYFDTVEISVFLNLLEVIDNLRRDEALISVLHSPLFRFTADELASVRVHSKDVSFADALLAYGETGEEEALRLRVRSFFASLETFREDARFVPLSDFLWNLMLDSGYYHYIGALPGGALRQANLRALTERASSFEANGGKGLSDWIRFVRQMKSGKVQIPQVKPNAGLEAVRIMTIHKSKGLEFPYVLIAQTGKPMRGNKKDGYPLSPDGILALPYVNREKRATSKTLLSIGLELQKEREERAEELRVLYVAMTRAKHKLVLTGTVSRDTIEAYESGLPMARGGVLTASSYLDWLLGSDAFRKETGSPHLHSSRELVSLVSSEEASLSAYRASLANGFGTSSPFAEELSRRLLWTYPYRDATETPSKSTVTELNRKAEGSLPFRAPLAVPSFARSGKISFSGAQKGTLLHRVLEHIPFREGWTEETVRAFIQEMVSQEFFTQEEGDAVPASSVVRFFESPIGKRAVSAEKAGTLFRETDFTLQLPDGATVQGTIDLFFKNPDGTVVLVDYKSNRLDDTETAEEALLETYRRQLLLYKQALEQIKHLHVSEVYLYAFSRDKALALKEEI